MIDHDLMNVSSVQYSAYNNTIPFVARCGITIAQREHVLLVDCRWSAGARASPVILAAGAAAGVAARADSVPSGPLAEGLLLRVDPSYMGARGLGPGGSEIRKDAVVFCAYVFFLPTDATRSLTSIDRLNRKALETGGFGSELLYAALLLHTVFFSPLTKAERAGFIATSGGRNATFILPPRRGAS